MNKKLGHFCKKISRDLIQHNLKLIKYFQYDLRRYIILLKVMENYYLDLYQTQEQMLESIPSHLSSRSNLLNIINHCYNENYFDKIRIKNNLRAKTIHPSPLLEAQFKQWIQILHKDYEPL